MKVANCYTQHEGNEEWNEWPSHRLQSGISVSKETLKQCYADVEYVLEWMFERSSRMLNIN